MKNNDYLSEYLTSECTNNIILIYIIHVLNFNDHYY